MVQPRTLQFLRDLSNNNNKPWFDAHKEDYAVAKADFETLTGQMLQALTPLEPALADQTAKSCIFRIFRDVRFSKDKTPYKSHFGAYFSRGGRKWPGAGYYLHIEPSRSFVAGGLWMPEPALLKSVRQEIDYNFEEFSAITGSRQFKKLFGEPEGEKLKTLPQGYTADNPAIEYLKMKSYIASHQLSDEVLAQKDFVRKCSAACAAMKPLVDFLNRALD